MVERDGLEHGFAYGVSVLMIAAVAAPLFKPIYPDSFPLSSYPMFSLNRVSDAVALPQALGVTKKGLIALPPALVANDEVMQAAKVLRHTVRRGPAASNELCNNIAERVAQDPDVERVYEVQVVTRIFHAVRYFSESRQPLAIEVHARCKVKGR